MAETEITRKRSDTDHKKKVGFVSLGCPKATIGTSITNPMAECDYTILAGTRPRVPGK
jgi:hypothetical protein